MTQEEKKRREFIKKMAGLGVLGLAAAAGIYSAQHLKAEELRLRPPGALEEDQFLALCIKCGQCLQVCPYDSIILEGLDGKAGVGTAYIDPDRRGCYLCKAFPCILACPSGALDHEKADIKFVHMGMAVIVNEKACLALYNKPVPDSAVDAIYEHSLALSKEERREKKIKDEANQSEKRELQVELLKKLEKFRGKDCTICADLCPFHPDPSLAIGMVAKNGGYIPEIREKCVGCGACVELCPTDVLKIVPRATYEEIYDKRG
ncbi:4Fe-4S dicluster domain-containing protein [Nitrosophilus labii]|uniref:4Fe-4S dicluster domain-containing protein n=1 Tax=Nitrosophilus labii TaxID=2706014 RepID=UPI001656B711|nr:4Fe-4S dicluster domain-containing protein [Nitrosophilus labii]